MSTARHVRSVRGGARYRFPTHVNELILDRKETERCEVFLVVLEPGESPPVHVHHDAEQVFYMIDGKGILSLGARGQDRATIRACHVVHIPAGTYHAILNTGRKPVRYLAVDVFTRRNAKEPTWEDHVRTICAREGWNFDRVRPKRR